ncbi:cell division protein FtsB [Teredinibacter haidensis]|uniref:cell division protein FtsB n=1 Tax=Teredinibacter haidensis TaxID=2731755 RepID=UPI0009490FD2|nr:cell division protein FtsB [Teredinibacter haidensis]
MKWILSLLFVLLGILQYRLWVGEGSIAQVVRLQQEITMQSAENERLRERNRLLAAEVEALKNGYDAIENRARSEMGMIKDGETFFMIVGEESKK